MDADLEIQRHEIAGQTIADLYRENDMGAVTHVIEELILPHFPEKEPEKVH